MLLLGLVGFLDLDVKDGLVEFDCRFEVRAPIEPRHEGEAPARPQNPQCLGERGTAVGHELVDERRDQQIHRRRRQAEIVGRRVQPAQGVGRLLGRVCAAKPLARDREHPR